jgi:hypothetical protein
VKLLDDSTAATDNANDVDNLVVMEEPVVALTTVEDDNVDAIDTVSAVDAPVDQLTADENFVVENLPVIGNPNPMQTKPKRVTKKPQAKETILSAETLKKIDLLENRMLHFVSELLVAEWFVLHLIYYLTLALISMTSLAKKGMSMPVCSARKRSEICQR